MLRKPLEWLLFVDNEDRAALTWGPFNDYDHRRMTTTTVA